MVLSGADLAESETTDLVVRRELINSYRTSDVGRDSFVTDKKSKLCILVVCLYCGRIEDQKRGSRWYIC